MDKTTTDQLVEKKDSICNAWINSKNVKEVLQKYSIEPIFFQKHFAHKILAHIIETFNSPSKIDKSPIMYIFTLFFKSKSIDLSDIFIICSELAFIIQEHFDDKTSTSILEILDNKLYVVEEYMDITREAIQNDQLFILNTKTNATHLKQIRFTSPNDLDSNGLMEILDDNQISNIADLKQLTDYLILQLDEVMISDSTQTYHSLTSIISAFNKTTKYLNTIALFPIITNSFDNLVNFLSTLKLKDMKDEGKRSLLVIMLIGLCEDLSKWIDTIFIQKIANDIYYADASFANNCLEIELVFDDSHKEKNTNLKDQIMNQDDLMIHLLD